jgi:hypothetical protein
MKESLVVLASVALAVGLLFSGSFTGTTDHMRKAQAQVAKPNIVFILADDQPESTLWYMPNVQSRLEDEGLAFTNAFNVYPLCCPSRAIIQRGQYAHNTDIFGNDPNRAVATRPSTSLTARNGLWRPEFTRRATIPGTSANT